MTKSPLRNRCGQREFLPTFGRAAAWPAATVLPAFAPMGELMDGFASF
jgi:hypothetical protein